MSDRLPRTSIVFCSCSQDVGARWPVPGAEDCYFCRILRNVVSFKFKFVIRSILDVC